MYKRGISFNWPDKTKILISLEIWVANFCCYATQKKNYIESGAKNLQCSLFHRLLYLFSSETSRDKTIGLIMQMFEYQPLWKTRLLVCEPFFVHALSLQAYRGTHSGTQRHALIAFPLSLCLSSTLFSLNCTLALSLSPVLSPPHRQAIVCGHRWDLHAC